MSRTVAAVIVETLEQAGVRRCYGVPGDTLNYVIDEDPAHASGRAGGAMQVQVSDGGEALFLVTQGNPLYVKVSVRGKKLGDLRREVKQLLDADYYDNATVRLELTSINRVGAGMEGVGKVMVYGEMQGIVQLPDGETKHISDAMISLGQNKFANLKAVRLHRVDPATGKTEITVINVDKILRDGDRTADVVLRDGDRIEVRPRTFNF